MNIGRAEPGSANPHLRPQALLGPHGEKSFHAPQEIGAAYESRTLRFERNRVTSHPATAAASDEPRREADRRKDRRCDHGSLS
jgi:hypothetical protein